MPKTYARTTLAALATGIALTAAAGAATADTLPTGSAALPASLSAGLSDSTAQITAALFNAGSSAFAVNSGSESISGYGTLSANWIVNTTGNQALASLACIAFGAGSYYNQACSIAPRIF